MSLEMDKRQFKEMFQQSFSVSIEPRFDSDEDLKEWGELLIEMGEELLEEYERVVGADD